MEFESPTRNHHGETIIRMNPSNTFICIYSSKLKNPVPDGVNILKAYVGEIARNFETYSVKWLSSPILSQNFINNLSHNWNCEISTDEIEKIVTVRQTWLPTYIEIKRGKYLLHWKLTSTQSENNVNTVLSSGQDDDSNIPYADETVIATTLQSPRARIKEKIRVARIKATALKWKLNELMESYYEKYGTFEGIDKESPLSSDIDSNPETNGKK